MKRFFASLLTCALLLGLLPTAARAAEGNVTLDVANGNIVITGTGYSVGGAAETAYTGNYTLTGTASMKTVTINGGTHTITLKGLNMTNTYRGGTFGLQLDSTANVILVIDGTNTITAGGSDGNAVPIFVHESANLTIRSVDGTNNHTLNAIGTSDGKAAIGGSWDYPSGSITIQSGTINATGGGNCASVIGKGGDSHFGGAGSSSAPVTITGGVINCTALNQGNGTICIGGGNMTVNVSGCIISATGIDSSKIFDSSEATVNTIVNGSVTGNATLTSDYTLEAGKTLTILEGSTLTISNGVTLTNNSTIKNNGTLTNNGTINGDGSYFGTGTVNKANQTAPGTGEGYAINCTTEQITIESGYRVSSDKSDTIADGPIDPGRQLHVRKEENNFYNASDWTDFTTPSRGTTPSVSIDYVEEELNTTTAMQYVIGASGHGDQSWESCTGDMAAAAFGNWNGSTEITVQFRTAATQANYASEAQEVAIPARPPAPTGLQGVTTSFAGERDGQITGVSTDMEYKGPNSNSWMACASTEITGLDTGEYQVRRKAAASAFASEAASVTVGSGDERTYTLTVTDVTFDNAFYGYAQPEAKAITITSTGNSDAAISSVTASDTGKFTIGGSGSTVTAGNSITSWTVQPNAGLSAGEHTATITVTYNGEATAVADVSFTANGAPQDAPAAPVEQSKTHSSVTLVAVSANANGAAAQYSKDNGQTWQDSPEFTGLTPNTKYTFVVRYGAIGSYEESSASSPLEVTTDAAPVTMYYVTVNDGTGSGSYAVGDTVTITATVPSGQRFTGWTVNEGSVTLANASNATTTFTMPALAVTVTANFQSISSGGISSGGDGGSYTPPTYKPDVTRPSEGGSAAAVFPANPGRGDTVTVTPKPDQGYEVDQITVTDQNGNPVEVTVEPDGTYTFRQPNGRVKIEVTYKPVQPVETPWSSPFADVSEGDWYYEAVRFVQERGLMNGYSDGRFGPNDNLSRAQLAQILFNKEGKPGVNYLMDFSDVADEAWHAEAIPPARASWAATETGHSAPTTPSLGNSWRSCSGGTPAAPPLPIRSCISTTRTKSAALRWKLCAGPWKTASSTAMTTDG